VSQSAGVVRGECGEAENGARDAAVSGGVVYAGGRLRTDGTAGPAVDVSAVRRVSEVYEFQRMYPEVTGAGRAAGAGMKNKQPRGWIETAMRWPWAFLRHLLGFYPRAGFRWRYIARIAWLRTKYRVLDEIDALDKAAIGKANSR
jgi:hypothetical protein